MRVLILANGDAPSEALAQHFATAHSLFLATDGAAHRAAGLGIVPDIVCGDFDSVSLEVAHAEFPNTAFIPTPDQDRADLEKAVMLALERGASEITILGANGGRIDHTLANFALLLRYQSQAILAIVDDHSEVRALSGTQEAPGELRLSVSPNDTFSVISPTGNAYVTIRGVVWELEDYLLPVGTQGVSNVAQSEQIVVRVWGAPVFLCHLPRVRSAF
jgi:thiamine pyrophosphokinase